MTFTVMIATRDRRRDLELACSHLLRLRPAPDQVIICADGCRDDTTTMLTSRFPAFDLLENDRPMGSVYSRDRMLRLAHGDVVVSLDDDSYPIQPDFLARVRLAFSNHPEAAVMSFVELHNNDDPCSAERANHGRGRYVSAYANCAAAMRRRFYLDQAGFSNFFGHMYEEPDYALQCYAAGSAVWFEPSIVVRHRESPAQRRPIERHGMNARNELWSVWLRCPWPWLPLIAGYRVARQFLYACSEGPRWLAREPWWWWAALRGTRACLRKRRPVPWRLYRRWLRLARNPIGSVAELRTEFDRCGAAGD